MLRLDEVKERLEMSLDQLCEISWMFTKNPDKDFTRIRKMTFRDVIMCLICMEGGSLNSELLRYSHCGSGTVTPSAFIQQRNKISAEALAALLFLFVQATDQDIRYRGVRLLAADGSDFQTPCNKADADSYFLTKRCDVGYNIMHLDALYDIQQQIYMDANVCGKRMVNESRALCDMVDRSPVKNALVIADRGYESYNLMAHMQEKGWYYLFRIKNRNGIADGMELPAQEDFDISVSLLLTRKQSNQVKELIQNRNSYRRIPSKMIFDYLPKHVKKEDPAVFYRIPFRIVRFRVNPNLVETVATNLNGVDFPAEEIKKLYGMRWCIETSFDHLKYTLGMICFHAKEPKSIQQEIYAKLILHNFCKLGSLSAQIPERDRKFFYRVNFSAATRVCREYLRGNVTTEEAEALLPRLLCPVRPGRNRSRRTNTKRAVAFSHRLA